MVGQVCLEGMGWMELRHLRYFVAVAETGSLSEAATRALHTSQPSLSLFTRSARGIELTPAGRAFLDHARLVLSQVDAGIESARQIARPSRPSFTMGFLTGHELTWMPEALKILRDELPSIDVTISSQYSPILAEALSKGTIDAAFMRREPGWSHLEYQLVAAEPMIVYLPSDHRLAQQDAVGLEELAGETFLTVSRTAPVLRKAISDFLEKSGLNIQPSHEVDHLTMAMSMIASTRGVAVLPAYLQTFLPWAVTTRPLKGMAPTIDLVLGYKRANKSPILRVFLSRLDELMARGPNWPR